MSTVTEPQIDFTEFHGMLTCSAPMRALFDLLGRVAQTEASVLLRGETGVGKELAARAIHRLSRRAAGPFRAINCATLTPELAASELFGHVRGAFTGAVRDRDGLFALANGGTVFLDEVAELPLPIQARLLRVLQERTFIPVGGMTPREVDIRLLAATHQSLRHAVEEQTFREDLMYRIRVVPVYIPPLAERGEDITALAWRFVGEFNRTTARNIDRFTDEAYAMLRAYAWPGNIRELRNVIEYAFAVGVGETITAEHLPPELRGELPPQRQPAAGAVDDERQSILAALAAADGQKSRAAEQLGISRTTLWRRMRELKLSDD